MDNYIDIIFDQGIEGSKANRKNDIPENMRFPRTNNYERLVRDTAQVSKQKSTLDEDNKQFNEMLERQNNVQQYNDYYSSGWHSLLWVLLIMLVIGIIVSAYFFGKSWLDGNLCHERYWLPISLVGYGVYILVIAKLYKLVRYNGSRVDKKTKK